jgi:hypothetical protein
VKFGDECTRFFHANASIKLNRNSITSIRNDNGSDLTNHEHKALFIWQSFKERFGISEFSGMNIDLATLITPALNLDWLHGEFQKEEIDIIIANLPNNKSPGPDGFNGEFLKKCWPLIADDFYELCSAFFDGSVCLQSISPPLSLSSPKRNAPSPSMSTDLYLSSTHPSNSLLRS